MSKFKAGHVCIIGKPNVGKSTLLNRLVSQKISIVSRKPQTTRCRINGIKNSKRSQIIFVDTPGFQINPKITLNRHMNKEVSNSLVFVDIVVFVIEALNWNELDYNVVKLLKNIDKTKLFLAVNKIDKIPEKEELLSEIDLISKKIKFNEIIPISAIKGSGVERLEELVVENLPISDPYYPLEDITHRDERFFSAEFIREKLITRLSDEVPYELSVTIDEFKETKDLIHINACIWVKKDGQKSIVIGKNGKVLKEIGRSARIDLEKLFNNSR